ncbi:hypothetical protein [Labilibaculum sp.]|uniref:hypothetical protein n=1 Tax=Labilibaculum sp. TaxID=2060723 RepID=UPI002AA86D6B|nr:hypothetical protein [Labilibaculum sp.]MBN2595707.1 hypothetical protein [Marinifilaceae bacterium]
MSELRKDTCLTCGKQAHDFANEEALNCVPPREILIFGEYVIDKQYRDALFEEFPIYTTEEVVGSYFGHNPYFPSQDEWLDSKEV